MEWNDTADRRLKEYLARPDYLIPNGMGTEEAACSMAAINLALNGKLTDLTPECMSPIIGHLILDIQDNLPSDLRNSREWREMLPLAAGTGREHERERARVVIDWMFDTTLPLLQPPADKHGFGSALRRMCTERTDATCNAAHRACSIAQGFPGSVLVLDSITHASLASTYFDCREFNSTACHASSFANVMAKVSVTELGYPLGWGRVNALGLLHRLIDVSAS